MPRAPILPSVVPGQQATQQPLYNAPQSVPQRDFTGQQLAQQGEAVQMAGISAANYASVAEELDAIPFAEEAETKYAEDVRNIREGYKKKYGGDAERFYDQAVKEAQDAMRKRAEELGNPAAKRVFQRAAKRRLESNIEEFHAHRSQQRGIFEQGTKEAAKKGAILDYQGAAQDALRDGSPEQMKKAQTYFDTAMQRAEELSAMRGESPEQARISMLGTSTELHGSAVDGMLEQGQGFAAVGYLTQHKDQIARPFFDDRMAKARVHMVREGAMAIDQKPIPYDAKLAEVDAFAKQGVVTPDEAESAKRHLAQFKTRRMQEDAIQERQLRDDWDKVRAQNPLLRPEDFPEITARAKKLGVVLSSGERQTIPAFEAEIRRMPMEQLRAMTDDQLRNYLSRGLNKSDENRWFAFVRGDQVSGRLEDDYQRVARLAGVDPKSPAMDEWKRNTLDPRIQQERDILKRDLTEAEIRAKVLAPLEQMVKVDDMFTDSDVSMAQVKAQNIDPAAVYVPIKGKPPVYWTDIPPDRMAEIARDYQKANPNGTLTFERMALIYDRMGRPAGATDMGKAEEAARVNAALREFGLDSWPQFSKKSAQDTARSQFRSAGIQVPMTQQEREAAMRAMDPKNRR